MRKKHLAFAFLSVGLAGAALLLAAPPNPNVGTGCAQTTCIQNGNLTNSVIAHWAMEEAATPSRDQTDYLGFPLTWSGTTQAVGKVGNAGAWAGGADERNNGAPTSTDARVAWPAVFTVNVWVTQEATRAVGSAVLHLVDTGVVTIMSSFAYADLAGVRQLSSVLSNQGGGVTQSCSFNAAPAAGAWHMLTAVIDTDGPTYQVLYEDGALVGAPACTGLVGGAVSVRTVGDWRIGRPGWGGSIDELSIFNRALTASEISCLYNGGSGRAWPWEGC